MKKKLLLKRKNLLLASIQILPFVLLYCLSITILHNFYLFKWTASNYYLGLWILIPLLAVFGKLIYSFSLSGGNILGILLGQFVGDWVRSTNMAKITSEHTPEEIYRLSHHPGFTIWLITLFASLVVGVILQIVWRKKHRKPKLRLVPKYSDYIKNKVEGE